MTNDGTHAIGMARHDVLSSWTDCRANEFSFAHGEVVAY